MVIILPYIYIYIFYYHIYIEREVCFFAHHQMKPLHANIKKMSTVSFSLLTASLSLYQDHSRLNEPPQPTTRCPDAEALHSFGLSFQHQLPLAQHLLPQNGRFADCNWPGCRPRVARAPPRTSPSHDSMPRRCIPKEPSRKIVQTRQTLLVLNANPLKWSQERPPSVECLYCVAVGCCGL